MLTDQLWRQWLLQQLGLPDTGELDAELERSFLEMAAGGPVYPVYPGQSINDKIAAAEAAGYTLANQALIVVAPGVSRVYTASDAVNVVFMEDIGMTQQSYFGAPCPVSLQFGPVAGFNAAIAAGAYSAWISLYELSGGQGIEPGSLQLSGLQTTAKSAGTGANVFTMAFNDSAVNAGMVEVTVTVDEATSLGAVIASSSLAAVQYMGFVKFKWVPVASNNGATAIFLRGSGVRASAAVPA